MISGVNDDEDLQECCVLLCLAYRCAFNAVSCVEMKELVVHRCPV